MFLESNKLTTLMTASIEGLELTALYAVAVQEDVGEAIIKSEVGSRNRPGGHSIEPFDWQRFLEFA